MSDTTNEPIVYIQVAPNTGPVSPQSATDDFIEGTAKNLRQVAGLIRTSCSNFVNDVKNLPNPPSELSIEFGIDVGAEGGVPFITKGSIGANFKVSVTWKKGDD